MFQSFTGSSRRPRQVNLSGQDIDPFAASSWAPTASGTRKTVANAQQERLQRQQDRERLRASKTIQRVWRGHKSRMQSSSVLRKDWDDLDSQFSTASSQQRLSKLPEELRLILAFCNPRNHDDIVRLDRFCGRLFDARERHVFTEDVLWMQFPKLANLLLATLEISNTFYVNFLRLISTLVEVQPQIILRVAPTYYSILATLLARQDVIGEHREVYLAAIQKPLIQKLNISDSGLILVTSYNAFASSFLSSPELENLLGSFYELAALIDLGILSQTIGVGTSLDLTRLQSEGRLWLLAHLIAIARIKSQQIDDSSYMRALSILLSACATDIVGKADTEVQGSEDDDDAIRGSLQLPRYIKDQLITLVNKDSITGLLATFNISSTQLVVKSREGDSSLLASYALLLLRIFPRLGEEIRMWLYQGSIALHGSTTRLPAVKLFWEATTRTKTFAMISSDSRAALSILRAGVKRQQKGDDWDGHNQDWRAILLFLELYAFILRFTDDEEFLNGGAIDIRDPNRKMSRSRESALPLQQVQNLTVFLKNLSFTMFYNAAELTEPEHDSNDGSLGYYFGTVPSTKSTRLDSDLGNATRNQEAENQNFLGVAGMTFTYVREIVARVMRMLYERDSRRRFLPKDHWLMTSRFEMEGFIPAVVAEEERRHQITENGEEFEEDDDPYDDASGSGIIGNHMSRRQIQLESLRRQQQRATRRKTLAAIGPRLEILQNMPYAIPFETRVQIFRQFVYQDQLRRRGGSVDPDHWRMTVLHSQHDHHSTRDALSRHHAKIRRDNLFEDAYGQFYDLGDGLKEPIQITFVDQFDTVEAGIDGGGVTKEFLTSVTKEAFGASNISSLFVTNDQNLLYPNPEAMDERKELLREGGLDSSDPEWRENLMDLLKHYEFLGRIIGKCLYEGILVDISFAGFFLLKWASNGVTSQDTGYLANINDLRDLDEELYKGLLDLKNYAGNVEDFSTDFTITDTVSMRGQPTKTVTRELLPDGANIAVTNENRMLYVSLVARHRLHRQPYQQSRAFLRGLGDIITPTWLSMFNQSELQTLIGGDSSEIDVEDLRRNTQYSGVYQIGDDGLEHSTIQLFWEVMKALDDADRRKVLKYVTSTPRAPLLGFSQLNPRFSIRDAGADEQRLPSTSTCINLMKLPRYSTHGLLKEKLLYAVNSGAGFDLS